jgi:hypothetical protein
MFFLSLMQRLLHCNLSDQTRGFNEDVWLNKAFDLMFWRLFGVNTVIEAKELEVNITSSILPHIKITILRWSP